jgi:hypothetical protein
VQKLERVMRSRGYKAVGKKQLKEEVLEFMEESMEENGYTTQYISDSLEISANLARESLFRLIKDDKVYRVPLRLNNNDRSTFTYFLKSQPPSSGRGVINDIDPSIVSWPHSEFKKRYIKKEKK